MCKLWLGETAKNVGNLQEVLGIMIFLWVGVGCSPLLGLEHSPVLSPRIIKVLLLSLLLTCLLPLFPHTFILILFHILSFCTGSTPLCIWVMAGEQQLPLPLWGQGCGYLCFPGCRKEWDLSWRWPPAVSADVDQPRCGDMRHEHLAGILLWGPLESQWEDEWGWRGFSTQGLGGREGAPLNFRSTSYEWIARLVGELWLSGSCRHWDKVVWLLSDCPLQTCWE